MGREVGEGGEKGHMGITGERGGGGFNIITDQRVRDGG